MLVYLDQGPPREMKQRSLKVTPSQICIVLFRAIASTFISEPVRTCAPLCGLITRFLKGLGRLLGTGSLWGGFSWDKAGEWGHRHFSVNLGEKWKVLNTVPKIWLTLFYKDPGW